MYHPVKERSREDLHEFIELHNRSDVAVAVGGWKITGGITYAFPMGQVFAPKGYLVIAKSPADLKKVAKYMLGTTQVLGPYEGELDNGGERFAIEDGAGNVIEQVGYTDDFPWPIGADALGAGEDWLRPEWRPVLAHQFMGRSLERINFNVSAAEVSNWTASPLDGATPGRPGSASGDPPPIAEQLYVVPQAPGRVIIRAADKILVRARFSARGTVARPEVEYFVDDVEKKDADEPKARVPLAMAQDGLLEAALPPQADHALVRYRVVGDRGRGQEVISPRDSDPFEWHAAFVSPDIPGKTRVYHLFLARSNWGRMHQFIAAGRVPAMQCAPNPNWNSRVPAVFVADGRVHDVMVRYQGSRYNRGNGARIAPAHWPPAEGPQPPPTPNLRALSWRLFFPRYAPLVEAPGDKRRDVVLNKMTQACQAFATAAGGRMFEAAGVPASRVHYVRLFINRRYYHYMAEYERPGEEMLERFYGKAHVVGDLFKSEGVDVVEGPYGWGDERVLPPFCGFSTEQRMAYTYDRKTPNWKTGSAELLALVQDLATARARLPDTTATRKFFETHFDLGALGNYYAIMNWMVPFDDYFQNHLPYRKDDGKWMIVPWDLDLLMGRFSAQTGVPSAQSSFYSGEQNDRSNRSGWWNLLKDAYIKTYRSNLQQTIRGLTVTGKPLDAAVVSRLVDEAASGYVREEAAQSPAARSDPAYINACGGAAALAASIKTFARDRNARVALGAWQ